MVEIEGLEEGAEGRVGALLATREIAAVDLADLNDDPEAHHGHANDATENATDEVDDEQVGRVPRPEHRVGQLAVAENDPVAQEDEELGDDEADHDLEDGADRHVVLDREDGEVEHARGDGAERNEEHEGEDEVLRVGRRHHLPEWQDSRDGGVQVRWRGKLK